MRCLHLWPLTGLHLNLPGKDTINQRISQDVKTARDMWKRRRRSDENKSEKLVRSLWKDGWSLILRNCGRKAVKGFKRLEIEAEMYPKNTTRDTMKQPRSKASQGPDRNLIENRWQSSKTDVHSCSSKLKRVIHATF